MIIYLIKSSLCLSAFLLVYYFILERENMHVFKRIYLLISLLFSFIVPFISFEFKAENALLTASNDLQTVVLPILQISSEKNYFSTILYLIYGLVTFIFLIRFIWNLYTIQKVRNNAEIINFQGAKLALVDPIILPHTFGNTIFINKQSYESQAIENELFTHELTHVREKHTLDVLLIELLKTIFWFNPLLILYKRAIQLNHEFLADEKVVKSYNNVPFYQNLLLEKASWKNTYYLASNLNYLVTKKRLIMMTKTTSQSRAMLKKLALVPILGAMIFISCSENVSEKQYDEKVVVSTWENAKAFSSDTSATNKTKTEVMEVNAKDVPSQPEFPGGTEALYKFVAQEFKIPEGYKGDGKIILTFAVSTNGTLEAIKVIVDPGFGTGEEAERMMKTSPKWKPGLLHGKPVRVQFYLPIQLDLK